MGQSWPNFMCSITGVGERLHKVLGQIRSKLEADWIKILVSMATESPHWLLMGKMVSPPFLGCFWLDLFCTLYYLDEFEFRPDRTTSSFILDRIIFKVSGHHQDRHKSSVEFDFGPNQTAQYGVTCPWVTKISHFWTSISLKPVG